MRLDGEGAPLLVVVHDSTERAALYCRVSTSAQKVDLQLDALRELCRQRGWAIAEEYADVGVSGSRDRRPELDRMLADARRRKLDVVVFWKLDRLARSVRHLLQLAEECDSLGIDLCSCTEPIDTTSSIGKFVFVVLGAVGQFERDLNRERVRAGMKAAQARGKKIGRPRLLLSEKDL
ncbi:MAG: recombinase family protein, partial [Planctomycetota bacterium]